MNFFFFNKILKIFFLCGPFLKVFMEYATILFLFHVLVSCETCGILAVWPGWSNLHLPHWKMKSQPLVHQESPPGWTFDVIKVNILRREGHPGLSGWTLSMITRVPIGGRQKSIWHGGEGGGTDVKRSGIRETRHHAPSCEAGGRGH